MTKLFSFLELLLLLSCFNWIGISEVESVERCQLVSNRNAGFCKSIYECPVILNTLKQNHTRPVYCSEVDEVVCCPYQIEGQRNMRISEKKCLEYLKYTFEQVNTLPEDPEDDAKITYLDRCGVSAEKYAIVGGDDASIREFPHMVAIGDNTIGNVIFWFCGGSLISENFVLTAAHCIVTNEGNKISPRIVKLGALNLDVEESAVRIYEVEHGITYPQYKHQFVYNDIGLLKLKKNVELNTYIRPICLPTDTTKQHALVCAIGWGKYKGASYEGVLQQLQLPLVPIDDCKNTYNEKRTRRLPQGLNENILCYGALKDADTCPGASGGPLQVINPNVYCSYTLVGITSAGVRCTDGYPGLFTKVSRYLDWIEAIVWGSST